MVVTLLASTFVIAFAVASIVIFMFNKPVDSILKRVVPPDISYAWARYLKFAIYVVGIGGGVQVWEFEKYLTLQDPYKEIVQLTSDRWLLEIWDGDRDTAKYGYTSPGFLRVCLNRSRNCPDI